MEATPPPCWDPVKEPGKKDNDDKPDDKPDDNTGDDDTGNDDENMLCCGKPVINNILKYFIIKLKKNLK